MKKHNKFFITIFLLVLLCPILVFTGSTFLSRHASSEEPYDAPESIQFDWLFSAENPPVSYRVLLEKYSVYNHISPLNPNEDNGKWQIVLFSEEQLEELSSHRTIEERHSLTYEEIFFLIDNSLWIYKNFDYIVLPDASYVEGLIIDNQKREEKTLEQQTQEVLALLSYRLCVLDGGVLPGVIENVHPSGLPGTAQTLYLNNEITDPIINNDVFLSLFHSNCYVMIIDEDNLFTSTDVYHTALQDSFNQVFAVYYEPFMHSFYLEQPLILININNPLYHGEIIIAYEDNYTEYSIEATLSEDFE